MEKNDGLERCLHDDLMCFVENVDDDDYLKKYVTYIATSRYLYLKIHNTNTFLKEQ